MKLPPSARDRRLDQAVKDALSAEGHHVSVREVRRAIREGRVRIDGRTRDAGDRAKGGEEVELGSFTPRLEAELAPEASLLDRVPVLYEDGSLLALAKPSGIPTAPLR